MNANEYWGRKSKHGGKKKGKKNTYSATIPGETRGSRPGGSKHTADNSNGKIIRWGTNAMGLHYPIYEGDTQNYHPHGKKGGKRMGIKNSDKVTNIKTKDNSHQFITPKSKNINKGKVNLSGLVKKYGKAIAIK